MSFNYGIRPKHGKVSFWLFPIVVPFMILAIGGLILAGAFCYIGMMLGLFGHRKSFSEAIQVWDC